MGYSYDMNDRRIQTSLPDGTSWRYGYDRLSQVVSDERVDADGNMLSNDGWTYAWNAQDRLASARGKTSIEVTYSRDVYSGELGILDDHFESSSLKVFVFVMTDVVPLGSLLKKVLSYDGSGQLILRRYFRTNQLVKSSNFLCVCENGKTHWRQVSGYAIHEILGKEDLIDLNVIDMEYLNKLTEKDRINLLASYILGAVEAATSGSPIIH